MTVLLSNNAVKQAEPFFIDLGAVLSSSLGGEDQRLNRIGSRFGCDFVTKPMKGDDASVWISRLIAGAHEKARIKFPQPGVTITLPDGALAAPVAANQTVLQLTAAAAFHEGWFLSLLKNSTGRRYLHNVRASTNPVGGVVAVTVQPPLRTSFVAGDVFELNPAYIEGYVKGDQRKWTIDDAKIYGLSFTIEE